MKITEYNKENLLPCAKLWKDVFNSPPWNDTWTLEQAQRRLEIDFQKGPGFIAIIEQNIIGFITTSISIGPNNNGLQILDVCVDTKHQKNGIGSSLLKKVEEYVSKNNMSFLFVLTAKGFPSETFYKKNGYVINPITISLRKITK